MLGDDDEVLVVIDDLPEVVLQIGNRRFRCRRNLLASKSPYFAAMFASDMLERQAYVVSLNDVSAAAFALLVNYMRSGTLLVTEDNVEKLLQTSAMLQFEDVKTMCCDHLLNMLNASSCLGVMYLADRFALATLHLRAMQIALWHFESVKEYAEILDIPLANFLDYLSNDGLNVTGGELQVFKAVVRWINHDVPKRLASFEELLQAIRFSQTTIKEIKEMMKNEVVRSSPFVRRVLHNIWKIKFELWDRVRRGRNEASSSSSAQSSDVSPVESTDSLNDCQAQEGDANSPAENASKDERTEATKPKPTDGVRVLEELTAERFLARRLLIQGPRHISTYPALVGHIFWKGDKLIRTPDLIMYLHQENVVAPLTKIVQKENVAIGYRVCAIGSEVYVVGGEFLYGHNNWNMAVWKYDIFSKAWTFVCKLNSPRRHHALCVLDHCVYVIGGVGRFRVNLNSVERLCTASGNCMNVAPLPISAYLPTTVSYKGRVYIFKDTVYQYNPRLDIWTCFQHWRTPRGMSWDVALAHDNGIYLLGGLNKAIVRFTPSRGHQQPVSEVVGQFERPSRNACIIGDDIYSFSIGAEFVIELFDITTGRLKVVRRVRTDIPEDVVLSPTECFQGCFALPYYGGF